MKQLYVVYIKVFCVTEFLLSSLSFLSYSIFLPHINATKMYTFFIQHYCRIVSQDFNPEKYQQLCGILSAAYLTTGSPVSIVPHFLSVFTRGEIVDPPAFCQPFSVADHDIRKAYVACSFKGN